MSKRVHELAFGIVICFGSAEFLHICATLYIEAVRPSSTRRRPYMPQHYAALAVIAHPHHRRSSLGRAAGWRASSSTRVAAAPAYLFCPLTSFKYKTER